MKTIHAVFENGVFRPTERVNLPEKCEVEFEPRVIGNGAPAALDDVQRRIWEFVAGQARHMDEIARHLSLTVSQASNALVLLEMKKVVRRLPGNYYERS